MRYSWKPYVPVGERKLIAIKEMEKLRKKGMDIQPVTIDGRTIAKSFWGKAWCDHLESFSDFANRLPRGRSYARNGSVCHLAVNSGAIEAHVSGSVIYTVKITVNSLRETTWEHVKTQCFGRIGSMLELLQGRLSDEVMHHVCDRKQGLFPLPGEMKFSCSCPDWAGMCKHVAAALYGMGNRLDSCPELLFLLRGVDATELIAGQLAVPQDVADAEDALAEAGLSALFGVDIDLDPKAPVKSPSSKKKPAPKARIIEATPPPAKVTKPARKAALPRKAPEWPAFDPDKPKGRDIAALRTRAGMSVPQFAEATGLSTTTIDRLERTKGLLRLQPQTRDAIARFQEELLRK